MTRKIIGTLKICTIFICGVVIGAVLMNFLHMYVRPMYRQYLGISLAMEQEFLADQAIRHDDKLREVVHRWNVVFAQSKNGFRVFRKEWNKDMDGSFFFPFYVVVAHALFHPKKDSPEGTPEITQGLARGQLALSLETIGSREEADRQWQAVRTLTKLESIEGIRKAALIWREDVNTELHLQAEKVILGDDQGF